MRTEPVRRLGLRVDDWRPAPFGRIRKVLPAEAARWTEPAALEPQAQPLRGRDKVQLAAQIAAWNAAGLTVPEQAEQLGVKLTTMGGLRQRLSRAGLLTAPRGTRGRWTARDSERLVELVEAGYGYDHLTRVFKRTRMAVILKCRRLGVRITTTPVTLSARDVAAELGIPCAKTVTFWVSLGWLPARNAGRVDRPLWRITWEDLTAMLERRETWMAWHPERIADLALREWAMELRAAAGGRWLSIGEVAERHYVGYRAVNTWIRKGWLAATRYGNWWIWSGDLDGWVLPCERSRKGVPRASRRVLVGRDAIGAAA